MKNSIQQEKQKHIPLVDLQRQYATVKQEIDKVVQNVLQETHFIMGADVQLFEKEFAAYNAIPYCVALNSGTDALILSTQALGIGKGDEVIIPVNTFIATAFAVTSCGATPVFVDIDPNTYLIDTTKIEEKITQRTKAIIPVHLYGQTAPMDKILALAKKYDLAVIEDACQAHGALFQGKRAGTFGQIGCFSFYPGKNLGAYGDGGAIITSDPNIAEKISMLRQYGEKKKYYHKIYGTNSRLDTLQAAILRVKLKHLDRWNHLRIAHAQYYDSCLTTNSILVQKPTIHIDGSHVYHLYVVQVKERERMQQVLSQNNISTGIHYPIPLHLQEAYSTLGYKKGDFPHAEKAANQIISLPLFPELTKEEIARIAEALQCQ